MSAVKNDVGLWETEIDSQMYSFQKWGAEESLETLLKISKIVGKPVAAFLGDLLEKKEGEDSLFEDKTSILDKGIDSSLIQQVFSSLIDSMNDEKMCVALIKKLASNNVMCDGKKISNFSSHYEDRLDHMFKVVYAGLEVQYGNFFAALLTIIPSKKPTGIVNQGAQT